MTPPLQNPHQSTVRHSSNPRNLVPNRAGQHGENPLHCLKIPHWKPAECQSILMRRLIGRATSISAAQAGM